MNFRERAKQAREDLVKAQSESLKSKDDKSGGFGSIFDKMLIPEDRQLFLSIKEGDHVIDIIPWFAGPNHPNVGDGKLTYLVDYWAHYNVGPMNDVVGCNQYMYRKPCPICEYINKQRLPKEEYTNVKAKRRCAYLVWNHNNMEEERKGIQIMDLAHFCMEANLVVIASNPKGGGSVIFSDPDNGKTLVFTRKGTGQFDTKYLGHRFMDRDAPIPDFILDQVFQLENCMNLTPDYDELKEKFSGGNMGKKAVVEENSPDDVKSAEGCPGGGTIGSDLNKLELCKTCAIWDACYESNKNTQPTTRPRRFK